MKNIYITLLVLICTSFGVQESVFEWLQIDEVQDLNPLQWAIVNKITDQQSHRVFFGDYEQAIFSFMILSTHGGVFPK